MQHGHAPCPRSVGVHVDQGEHNLVIWTSSLYQRHKPCPVQAAMGLFLVLLGIVNGLSQSGECTAFCRTNHTSAEQRPGIVYSGWCSCCHTYVSVKHFCLLCFGYFTHCHLGLQAMCIAYRSWWEALEAVWTLTPQPPCMHQCS